MANLFEPGSANAYERQEIKDPEPPPGFVDNTVYVYRLDENGNKVLVRTEKAFPEPEKTENGKVKLNFSVKGKVCHCGRNGNGINRFPYGLRGG